MTIKQVSNLNKLNESKHQYVLALDSNGLLYAVFHVRAILVIEELKLSWELINSAYDFSNSLIKVYI